MKEKSDKSKSTRLSRKYVLGQKKVGNNFFDADHHFEPHEIGF